MGTLLEAKIHALPLIEKQGLLPAPIECCSRPLAPAIAARDPARHVIDSAIACDQAASPGSWLKLEGTLFPPKCEYLSDISCCVLLRQLPPLLICLLQRRQTAAPLVPPNS